MPTPRMNGVAVMADPLYKVNLMNQLHLSLLEDMILGQLLADVDQSPWFAQLTSSVLGRMNTNCVLPRLLGCHLMHMEVAQVAAGDVVVTEGPTPVVSDDLFATRFDDPTGLRAAAAIFVAAVRNRDQTSLESLQAVATAAITARKERGAFIRSTDFAAFWTVKRLSEIALKAMAASVSEEGS